MSPCPVCGAPRTVYDRVCDCGELVHAKEIAELEARARIGRMAQDASMERGALVRITQLAPEGHPAHEAASRALGALSSTPDRASASSARDPREHESGGMRSGPSTPLLLIAGIAVCAWLLYAFFSQ